MIYTITILLLLLIFNSLHIIGIYESVQFQLEGHRPPETTPEEQKPYKMIFWWVKFYGDLLFPEWLTKPLYNCCTCMSSIHSSYIYWGAMYLQGSINLEALAIYPIYIFSLAGLVTLICNKFY